jgi:hypothetical protein
LIQRESRRMAQGLLQNPNDFITHVQRSVIAGLGPAFQVH